MAVEKETQGGSVLIKLTEEFNQLLIQTSKRSGRSKTKEALIRLQDSLRSYSDLAATGKRFDSAEECE